MSSFCYSKIPYSCSSFRGLKVEFRYKGPSVIVSEKVRTESRFEVFMIYRETHKSPVSWTFTLSDSHRTRISFLLSWFFLLRNIYRETEVPWKLRRVWSISIRKGFRELHPRDTGFRKLCNKMTRHSHCSPPTSSLTLSVQWNHDTTF